MMPAFGTDCFVAAGTRIRPSFHWHSPETGMTAAAHFSPQPERGARRSGKARQANLRPECVIHKVGKTLEDGAVD